MSWAEHPGGALGRIAELEAENARLKQTAQASLEFQAQAVSERDEARARVAELEPLLTRGGHEVLALMRQLDEARAEVEEIKALRNWGAQELGEALAKATLDEAAHDVMVERLKRAESYVAHAEFHQTQLVERGDLKARLEHLETNLQGALTATDKAVAERDLATARLALLESMFRQHASEDSHDCMKMEEDYADLAARLEKAEALIPIFDRQRAEMIAGANEEARLMAQLGAMRALVKQAVEHLALVDDHDDGPTEKECGICWAENTLSHALENAPSAPRLYRNAVLEEAAVIADEHCIGNLIRALKTEDGT